MDKKKISAKIIADSCDNRGNRLTSYLLTFPRFILPELLTHRMFSRNAASSRAIPFAKMVREIEEDPFIPIAWQKDHKGMQGSEYITDKTDLELNINAWAKASKDAISNAKYLNHGVKAGKDNGVTKQLCNRLLEPFQWMTVLVTATQYDNFFKLRCPKYTFHDDNGEYVYKSKKDAMYNFGENEVVEGDYNKPLKELTDLDWITLSESQAEIHIQALAEAMWDARNESDPEVLAPGMWHIPFMSEMDSSKIKSTKGTEVTNEMLKISTARCARLSYMTFDGEIDYEKDIKLHDQLLERKHASCFEHCARVMSEDEYNCHGITLPHEKRGLEHKRGWCRNFRGFIPYRHLAGL